MNELFNWIAAINSIHTLHCPLGSIYTTKFTGKIYSLKKWLIVKSGNFLKQKYYEKASQNYKKLSLVEISGFPALISYNLPHFEFNVIGDCTINWSLLFAYIRSPIPWRCIFIKTCAFKLFVCWMSGTFGGRRKSFSSRHTESGCCNTRLNFDLVPADRKLLRGNIASHFTRSATRPNMSYLQL